MTSTRTRARVLHNGAALLCALLLYYGLPLDWGTDTPVLTRVFGLVAFLAGLGGTVWLAARQLRRYLAAPEGPGRQVDGILLVLVVVIVFFALFYYRLEVHDPGQFAGLETRTDALYYTIVTLGTVGFGDIHAVGQAARVAVMVQIVFDLVVIGTLLAVMTTTIMRRLDADRPRE
ncbi:potassium channel family protein [Nocardia farcinica]|uniref:potassium channel family protein n=1 Tax=Nocardia farcinica TaxID=37329 RepID=UPI000A374447|nr:potassium channel family protein [Nocardia farcinica]MBA4856688.1 two pore domain potassium channel family protein [Nocardia farcinica]MBC9818832.1 two pore domain potassium channel family protein [Nocardia farcinica]SUE32200.1 ion transporter [Nocardia farcinica]